MTEKALKDVRFATVADVMSTNVVFIDGKEPVDTAIRLMRKKRVSSLVVNRRNEEDAWGIVTRKDIIHKIIDPGKHPLEVRVFQIMTKPVVTVRPELALKYCARLMHNANIRRAPVIDRNDIVGIVSNTDIFNTINV